MPLISVDIPLSVTDIGLDALRDCDQLTEVITPSSICEWLKFLLPGVKLSESTNYLLK